MRGIRSLSRGEIAAAYRLAAIVEASDDAIVSKDLNGYIITWNQAAERIFGFRADEAVGRHITLIIPPERRHEEDEILRRIRAGERVHHLETVRRRKDGSLIEISLTVSPIFNDAGDIVGASKIARDITDRRKADVVANRLAAIVESSDDVIIGKDLDGTITSWNQAAERVFGYTAQEAVGRHIGLIIPRELLRQEDEILGRIRQGGRFDHFETIRQKKDGTRIDASITVSPVKDATGRIIGASKIVRDITERNAAARRLEEERNRYAAAFENAAVGMAEVSLEGRWLRVNHTLCTITGYSPAELVGKTFREISHPDDDSGEQLFAELIAGTTRSFTLEKRYIRKDGSPVPVQLTVALVRSASGAPLYAISVVEDITRRRAAEQETRELAASLERQVKERTADLEATNAQLEAFTYTVSHDLRAPLRSMEGFARILVAECGDQLGEAGGLYTARIIAAAHRMELLISDLLAFSRLQRARLDLHRVELSRAVEDAVREVRQATADQETVIDLGPMRGAVRAEPIVLRQVLVNLLSNAIKFKKPSTQAHIIIGMERRGGNVRLWIADRGIGIAPEHRQRIFGAFERLHGQEEYPGTGVGLAIVKTGITRMNGSYGVESELGAGSRFWIELPAADQEGGFNV